MADLLGELDQQDADDLQLGDVNQIAVANAAMFQAHGVLSNENAEQAAFNMDEDLNQKYNVSVGAIRGYNKPGADPEARVSK